MSSIIRILLIFYKNVSEEKYIKELFDEIIPKRRCFKIDLGAKVQELPLPNYRGETLRESMAAAGISIDGISSDFGFKINGDDYIVKLRLGQNSKPRWTVDTNRKTIDIVYTGDYDEVHMILLSALIQYTPKYCENPLYQQLFKRIDTQKDVVIDKAA